jgi:molybdate transport system substrate-binding protein
MGNHRAIAAKGVAARAVTARAIAAIVTLGVALGLPLLTVQARAAELKVLSAMAAKTILDDLGTGFEKATDNKLVITLGPTGPLRTQIEQGAAVDVVILPAAAIDALIGEGKIDDATRALIAHVGVGVAVHKGAPKPDISTTEAFRRALLEAKSIGITDGGTSGTYLKTLFEKLGIADALKPKIKLLQGGAGEATANGEVEMGLTQISEIVPYADAELVGPLPAEIQVYTTYAAGVAAASKQGDVARALVKFLTAPAAADVIKAKGMEPG